MFFLLSVFLIFMSSALSGKPAQTEEEEVAKLLAQADAYYQSGDYKLAIGCYVEAAALAQSKINLSRAYFGLSVSYFFLRDMANATKWIRKVCEVDPKKEISELFYPRSFVQLFNQVQKEVREKKPLSGEGAVQKPSQPTEKKIVEEPKPKREEKEGKKTAPPKTQTIKNPAPSLEEIESLKEEKKGGYWEVGIHYSLWSIDLIKGLFEKTLKDELGEEIRNEVVKKLGQTHAGLVISDFTPTLSFDSEGSNYGFEIRFYSRGRAGTFSLGFSLEKTIIKLSVAGQVKQDFANGGSAAVNAEAQVETSPFSTNFSFRWDISPASRVSPYFVLGFGFAPLKGTFSYSYSGNYQWAGMQESIQDSQTKTFEELSEDIDFEIPQNFILLQINFGIKAEIYKGIYLTGEAGLWNGFLLRAGLAYRF